MSDRKEFSADLSAKVVGAFADNGGTPTEANIFAERPELVKGILAALRGKAEIVMNKLPNLRRLFFDKKVVIGETDGKATIAKAKNTFLGWIDPDFENYGTNVPSDPTKETAVSVYEMIKDGDYARIFGSLSDDLDKLCLTQPQIIQFVKNHRKWLRTDGYGTLFLFKVGNEYFVAGVRFDVDDRLRVAARRFLDGCVWRAGCRYRVVVPQLTP